MTRWMPIAALGCGLVLGCAAPASQTRADPDGSPADDDGGSWLSFVGEDQTGEACWLQIRAPRAEERRADGPEAYVEGRTSLLPGSVIELTPRPLADADRRAGVAQVWQDNAMLPVFLKALRIEVDRFDMPLSYTAAFNVLAPRGTQERCKGLVAVERLPANNERSAVLEPLPLAVKQPLGEAVLCTRNLVQGGRGDVEVTADAVRWLGTASELLKEHRRGELRDNAAGVASATLRSCKKREAEVSSTSPSGGAAWLVRMGQAVEKEQPSMEVAALLHDALASWPSVARSDDRVRVLRCRLVTLGANGAVLFGGRIAGAMARCTAPDGRRFLGITGELAQLEGVTASVDVGTHWIEEDVVQDGGPRLAPVMMMTGGLGVVAGFQMEDRRHVTGRSVGIGAGFAMGHTDERRLALWQSGDDVRFLFERLAGITAPSASYDEDLFEEPAPVVLELSGYAGKVEGAEIVCLSKDTAWLVSRTRARCLLVYRPAEAGATHGWRFHAMPVHVSGIGIGFSVLRAESRTVGVFGLAEPATIADVMGFYRGRKDYFPLGFEDHLARLHHSDRKEVSLRVEADGLHTESVGFEHAVMGVWLQPAVVGGLDAELATFAVERCRLEPDRYDVDQCAALEAPIRAREKAQEPLTSFSSDTD